MLRRLHIENIGLMDRVTLEFERGVNAITGETGAGKSLLLASLDAVLGRRSGRELARLLRVTPDGPVAEGVVCAEFELDGVHDGVHDGADGANGGTGGTGGGSGGGAGGDLEADAGSAHPVGADDLDADDASDDDARTWWRRAARDGEPLLLTRKVFASGRSSASVNGRPVDAATLRRLGDQLVEVHGQHDAQRLTRPEHQLRLIDEAAGSMHLRARYTDAYRRWRDCVERLAAIRDEAHLREQRIELYQHHLDEIERVAPLPGELHRLQDERKRLATAGAVLTAMEGVLAAMGGDEEAVAARLASATRRLESLVEHRGDGDTRRCANGNALQVARIGVSRDARTGPPAAPPDGFVGCEAGRDQTSAEAVLGDVGVGWPNQGLDADGPTGLARRCRDAVTLLDDLAYDLRCRLDGWDVDEQRAAEVEQRLDALHRLDHRLGRQAAETVRAEGLDAEACRYIEQDATAQWGRTTQVAADAHAGVPDAMAVLLAYRDWLAERLAALRDADDEAERLVSRGEALHDRAMALASELSKARRRCGKTVAKRVMAELASLGMDEAGFEVAWSAIGCDVPSSGRGAGDESPGAKVGRGEAAAVGVRGAGGTGGTGGAGGGGVDVDGAGLGPTGADRVAFMLRANPGAPYRPLREVASGGELSRVLLALRAAMQVAGRDETLVFDEVDANVGGRLGGVIAEKLHSLTQRPTPRCIAASGQAPVSPTGPANHATPAPPGTACDGDAESDAYLPAGSDASDRASAPRTQVLCVTHLPQVAALADRHFKVSKSVTGRGGHRSTRTSIAELDDAARREELAEMIAGVGGVGDLSRRQATQLMKRRPARAQRTPSTRRPQSPAAA